MARVSSGTILAGKYALVAKLGQGGMGSVWRAEHVQLRSPIAIKLIDEDIASDSEALARFMREAQSAAALRSPHVVQILDFGADNGVPYIAMELLEGESLARRIERTRGISPLETASIVTQVSRAIAKAHETGIVHRDLKPDNIFVVHNDEEEVAKVLDFGIAKAQRSLDATTGSNTRTGAILGTPYYMSPEQAEGNRYVDHRTDLWALGVIAFECLLGRRPFDSDALGSLLLAICTRPVPVPSSHGRVPRGFDAWFARACSRDPQARFQSARELAAELRRVCGVTNRDSQDVPAAVSIAPPTVRAGSEEPPPTAYIGSAPTANTYAASVGVGKSRGSAVAWLIGGAVTAVAVAGGGAWIVKQRSAAAEADASASAARSDPVTPPAPVVATLAPPAKAAEAAPSVTLTAPSPSDPVPSSVPAPVTVPKVTTLRKSSPKPKSTATATTTAPKPAPVAEPASEPAPPPAPKPAPPPAPKQKDVNLGI
jgi:serine/threonine-protein kinase